jgi:hypothetical protein
MSSPIDPLSNSPGVRRPRKTAAQLLDELEGKAEADVSQLPVPVAPAKTIPPRSPAASAAAIEAQLDTRRGLRAGTSVIDQAQVTYKQTEWSGSMDRRAPKGHVTKTEI